MIVLVFIRLGSISLYALVLGEGLKSNRGGLYMFLPYFLVGLPYGPMAEERGGGVILCRGSRPVGMPSSSN